MAFDPATLSPVLWVRADSLSALSDGDPVGTWPDLSASPNNFNASGSARPTYKTNVLNGHPVVRFAGNPQTMKTANATSPTVSQPYTLVVVGRASGNNQAYIAPFSGVGGVYVHRISSDNHFTWYFAGSAWIGGVIGSSVDESNVWASMIVANGSASTMRINGRSIATGNAPGSSALGGFTLGSCVDLGGYWLVGDIAEVILFSSVLSSDDQWNINNYLRGRYELDVRRWSNLVFDGDSLTDGYNVSEATQSYPAICCHTLPSVSYTSVAVSGWKLTQLEADAATRVDPLLSTNGDQQSLIVWAGINDITMDGASGQTVLDRLTTYCNSRRAAGWQKIITCTLTNQKYNLTYDANRLEFNTLLRTNWASISDSMIDLQAIDVLADPDDTTYFNADKLHLSAAGYAAVGSAARSAIDALLINPSGMAAALHAHYAQMRR